MWILVFLVGKQLWVFLSYSSQAALEQFQGVRQHQYWLAIWDEYEVNKDKEKGYGNLFIKFLPFFVFEMQSLEMFIKCTKTVLFKKGLISSNETRFDLELSPVAKSILERHFVQLMEVEQQFKGAKMLTKKQINSYKKNGYFSGRNVIPPKTLKKLQQVTDEFVEACKKCY